MILPQKVITHWSGENRQHYEALGYIFESNLNSGLGAKTLEVNAEDLPARSGFKIWVACDFCGIVSYITKNHHTLQENRNGGKYFCRKCAKSSRPRTEIQKVREAFIFKGVVPTFQKYENANKKLTFICTFHLEKGTQQTTYAKIKTNKYSPCILCRDNQRKADFVHRFEGIYEPSAVGGISEINAYLRGSIYPWVFDSLKKNNFKCVLSNKGPRGLVVHHFYKSFRNIRDETFLELGIPIRRHRQDYSQEELKSLVRICLEKHYKYGLGIPLHRSLHEQYHEIYGKSADELTIYNFMLDFWEEKLPDTFN